MIQAQLEPFYFGAAGKQLFGCYHAPQAGQFRDYGVVICYPLEPEYIRAHRACQQLAVRLAMAGFPVLRFDYYGCGDSAGDGAEGHFKQWLRDIGLAIAELKGQSGVQKVCLIGLRLGASLALAASASRSEVASVILWEPIVNGKAYLQELTDRHQETIWHYLADPENGVDMKEPAELLGLPLTDNLRADLESLNLLTPLARVPRNILIIEGDEEPVLAPLQAYLQNSGSQVTHHHVPDFQVWTENPDKGLVPGQTLQAILSWVSEVN
jgi:exosortase A-associated hydrolase 2